jgi:hypothetical protein
MTEFAKLIAIERRFWTSDADYVRRDRQWRIAFHNGR